MKAAQSCLTLCDPMDYTAHGILQARILEWVAFPFSGGIFPNPGIEPRSPAWQADSLPADPPGKPKNTGVGCLCLLQGVFPNPGMEPRSPAWQADSLPAEPPGKPICCKVTIKTHLATHTPALGCPHTHSKSGSKPVQASSVSCALR